MSGDSGVSVPDSVVRVKSIEREITLGGGILMGWSALIRRITSIRVDLVPISHVKVSLDVDILILLINPKLELSVRSCIAPCRYNAILGLILKVKSLHIRNNI